MHEMRWYYSWYYHYLMIILHLGAGTVSSSNYVKCNAALWYRTAMLFLVQGVVHIIIVPSSFLELNTDYARYKFKVVNSFSTEISLRTKIRL